MIDFKKLPGVKTEKMTLTLEIELNKSQLDPQEACDRLSFAMNGYTADAFSSFILWLLRNTKSRTYEIKRIEIN